MVDVCVDFGVFELFFEVVVDGFIGDFVKES